MSENEQWGLPLEAVDGLVERLQGFHERFRADMRTQTRDTSEYGFHYVSSLLRLESKRTMARIGRVSAVPEQNIQQFISDSPWSAERLIDHVQQEIALRPEYAEGSVLICDESADAKSGETTIGAGRQHNGRLGKIDCCQVGVFVGIANHGDHTWVDGDLYLTAEWFAPARQALRQRLGIPEERHFVTKLELMLTLVLRAKERGVPFAAVDCDSLYGRKGWLRDQLAQNGIEYYADIPENTRLWPLFNKRATGRNQSRTPP